MDTNGLISGVHHAEAWLWCAKTLDAWLSTEFCPWVSTFHPSKLSCERERGFYGGSFNMGTKVTFSDGSAWLVRFARGGNTRDAYVDEKVAMEVIALGLLRSKTTIPVPEVKAWGNAASNPFGIGPFIMMEFIEGVRLATLAKDPNVDSSNVPMREDFPMENIEAVYKQMANFLLQIFELDFDRIGSLQATSSEFQHDAPVRPLTFKVHTILQDGDVNTFGDRSRGFTTATEYFSYVIDQDWQQLIKQPNSVPGPLCARDMYKAFSAMRELMPQLVHPEYDRSKFKFICDDFGLANLIVRSEEDMTIVGVIDLEWSYIGPAQMLASAPWWLLLDRPVNHAWDYDEDDEPPKIIERYFKHLDIFTRILEKEEATRPAHKDKEFSRLLKWSRESGAMWLHIAVTCAGNDDSSFIFRYLRDSLEPQWTEHTDQVDDEEIEAFRELKKKELELYKEAYEDMQKNLKLMEDGVITKLEFVEKYSAK
ncbi:phosphotransferase enzyme family protein [Penicillium angulare]|uniref:phosphotransferase enzyme family protein n=1 Tax=Penicillium angulare TaxID=116970 RepID=UPI00254216A4|nr:phosphotransferase enzyme family protein [Penicillium angulare]KAJ5261087.1 phosphotransferase enzyme family protein [Penicillium angulare]